MNNECEYTTVRVTNPTGVDGMAKLTGEKKRVFLQRMAAGKRKAAQRRRNKTTKKTTRRKNPMKVGGIDVKPAAINGLGVALGAYFGGSLTNLLDEYVISKLGSGWGRTIGFTIGGIGTLVLGEWLQKKVKDFPVTATAAGASVPMWLAAFISAGVMPQLALASVPVETPPVEDTAQGHRRRMRGTIQPGMIPGNMRGTIQPGMIPGNMRGTIQPGMIPGNMGGSFGAIFN